MPTDRPTNPVPADDRPPPTTEGWLIFVLGALVTGVAGVVAVSAGSANWDALAALSHAQDVLRGCGHIDLGLIGFVEPPLPALLYLPIAALFPGLATTGAAVCLFGGIVGGLSVRMLNAIGADVGLGRMGRWGLCALFIANPIALGLFATGAPDGLYVLLLLGGAWRLLRWLRAQLLRDLIGSSILLGLALLTRYDALIPLLVAAALVSARSLREGGSWRALEGTALTFLLPGAYLGGLWVLANWVIMGDPLHFLSAGPPVTGAVWAITPWTSVVASAAVVGPLAASVWWAVWGEVGGRRRLALGPALVALSPALLVLVVPGWFDAWLAKTASADLPLAAIPDLLAPMLAAAALLTPCALADLLAMVERKGRARSVCLAGSAALLVMSVVAVMGESERVYVDPLRAARGRPFGAADARPIREVAARLAEEPAGAPGTLVIAGWPGYAITLYAGRSEAKVLLPDPHEPGAPVEDRPVAALLIRGESLLSTGRLRHDWEAAIGSQLEECADWSLHAWSYYPCVGAGHSTSTSNIGGAEKLE